MSRQLSKSWIDSFLDYANHSEIPREYLTWAAISTIASTIKLNCYVWYRGIKFLPNQYIMFVGPPGIGKDEAINKIKPIVEEANSVNYIKDWHTPQEILEEINTGWGSLTGVLKPGQIMTTVLTSDHTCCLLVPELAVFLGQDEKMPSLLCAWWNQDTFEYKTKNNGKLSITGMSVNMLGGCVPDYIRQLSKDRLAAITSGFTARTIFVYATEKFQLLPNSFGQVALQTSKLKQDLINDLRHIKQNVSGEITLDNQAKILWEQTYNIHNRRGNVDSDASQNFKSRISSHIVKTAISICVSETDTLVITRNQLERSIRLVEEIRDKVDIVFRSIGESPLSSSQDKLLRYIDAVGAATYAKILEHMYRDATEDQVLSILNLLEKVGLIKNVTVGNKQIYESAKTIVLPKPKVQGAHP